MKKNVENYKINENSEKNASANIFVISLLNVFRKVNSNINYLYY